MTYTLRFYLARADPKLVELHPFNRDSVVKAKAARPNVNIWTVFSESQLHPFSQTEILPMLATPATFEGRESGVGGLHVVSSVSSSNRWGVDLLSSEQICATLIEVRDYVCEDAFESCALEYEWR